jgi:xanthine dehydrogenase large subunit
MNIRDSNSHVRGESIFVDDMIELEGTLYAILFTSPYAHGRITRVDYSKALASEGVYTIITAKDIPGDNQIGGIIRDEELLVREEFHYENQPIAVILCTSELLGRNARGKILLEFEKLEIITDPRIAKEKNLLISKPRTFLLGSPEENWINCEYIVQGRADSGGQEHLYLETQGAYAYLTENNHVKVHSSTQRPTAVQKTLAWILDVPMHSIEVDVQRLGGGFGGKEDQATMFACLAGLCSYRTKRPVKVILHRMDDMKITGKRHPYTSDFKIGLDKNYNILVYEVTFYQNSGSSADLSPAVLERTLFHATNSYFIPNVRATAYPCKTNLPSNTAFRGFGGPQGMFVIESAISKAAEEIGISPYIIQKKNLIFDGSEFPYGQLAEEPQLKSTWDLLEKKINFPDRMKEIENFNNLNKIFKKGFAFMPICFGISFTKTHMNQAGALVHLYTDGSVSVSTAAVEMGQGVNTRILQVPISVFSIDKNRIKIETTNTTRVANTSPSAASSTHDLNGFATYNACQQLLLSLKKVALSALDLPNDTDINRITIKNEIICLDQVETELTWVKLLQIAYDQRVDLTAHGFYTPEKIHFNPTIEKGHPFTYHVFGTAFIQVTIDCLRGTHVIDTVDVVHDYGESMNKEIDLGQTEGGIVQGIGWMTSEEVIYSEDGKLLSNALSTYKVPDLYAVPKEINITFLPNSTSKYGLFKSKAIGEPPLMYGIGVYFALLSAIKNFSSESYSSVFDSPMTPEKLLLTLYRNKNLKHLSQMITQ